MLNIQDLESLETYIRSGQLEKDFQDGCENDRHYLLELLEKLMDVAELAGGSPTGPASPHQTGRRQASASSARNTASQSRATSSAGVM